MLFQTGNTYNKDIIMMANAKVNDNSKKLLISSNNNNQKQQQKQPPRIQVGGISIKQQIAWVKSYKKLKQKGISTSLGTKFRQIKGPKSKEDEYIEIDYNETKPPAIFVDGYNILGSIGTFNDENLNLEGARDGLINDLGVLSCLTGWFIEVVFDAYKNKANIKSKSDGSDGFIVTYTGSSETADNYIERRFGELKAQNFSNMVVATDDIVLRTVAGSSGAGYMPASSLLEEIRIAYMSWENTQLELENEIKRNPQPVLGDTMSDELKEAYIFLKKKEAEKLAKKEQEKIVNKEQEQENQRLLKLEKEKIRRENLKAKFKGKEKENSKKEKKWSSSNHHKPTLEDGLSQELLQAIEQLKKK